MGGNSNVPLMSEQVAALIPLSTRMRVLRSVEDGTTDVPKIATKLGIAEASVRRHLRSLAREGTLQLCQLPESMAKREADTHVNAYVLDAQIEVLGQLKEANESMWDLVGKIEKASEDREGIMTVGEINAYIRAVAEIRNQLQLQANLMEMMLRLETVKEFQEEVLRTIEEVDPMVAQKIKLRLMEKRAIKTAIGG